MVDTMYVIPMATDKFIDIVDNPRQRNTLTHARKAARRHLKNDSPTQLIVAVAKMGGAYWKLDGHTRAYMWKTGKLTKPENVSVIVYEVDSIEDVKELYTHFDNQYASECVQDRMFGAINAADLKLTSPLLRSLKFSTSLHYFSAINWLDEYQKISVLADELKKIDSWNLNKMSLMNPILSYLIMSLLLDEHDEHKLAEFAKRYTNKEGEKHGKYSDGPHALYLHLLDRRRTYRTSGWDNIKEIVAVTCTCVTAFEAGKMIQALRPSMRTEVMREECNLLLESRAKAAGYMQ